MKYRIVPIGCTHWGIQKCNPSYFREVEKRFLFWTWRKEEHVPQGWYNPRLYHQVTGLGTFESLEGAKACIDRMLGRDVETEKRKRVERERRAECPYIDYPEYY